jgi:type IV secretion system protein VirB11
MADGVQYIDFTKAGQGAVLKPLREHLTDPLVSEILINQPGQVYIEKHGEFTEHKIPEVTNRMLVDLFRTVMVHNKQSNKNLFYGSLEDGSRITLVAPPVSIYPTVSIRRKVVRLMTLNDYHNQKFFNQIQTLSNLDDELSLLEPKDLKLIELYQSGNQEYFIQEAIKAKKNIVISGGTSSGKTTFLNACLQEIPSDERIISIEDTRELEVTQDNYVSLKTTSEKDGGEELKMQDLVKACLRLRPDRIVMGEIRGQEIIDFITACSTGHDGSITTIHANNPIHAFQRMAGMYKQSGGVMTDEDIMRELKSVIDVVIQIGKTPQGRKARAIYYKYADVDLRKVEHVA